MSEELTVHSGGSIIVPSAVIPPAPLSRIASAIADIMREVGVVAKQGENQFHHYKYAKMEDVLKRITPLLAEKGIIILQSEVERVLMAKDSVIAIKYAFTIVHASGEVWPVPLEHTGMSRCMDSKGGFDDKAINKAHTAARKYFLLALFQIPTGEEDDADRGKNEGKAPKRHDRLPKKNARDIYQRMQQAVDAAQWRSDLDAWVSQNEERLKTLPEDWEDILLLRIRERRVDLQRREAAPRDGLNEVLAGEPPSAWDNLGPVKQAGVLCSDKSFWKFMNAGGTHAITDDEACAIVVRAICGITSRAELAVTASAQEKWNGLVAEFHRWQKDPDEADRILWDSNLATAAQLGVNALKAEWGRVPKHLQAALKPDLDTIHKPHAEKVTS